MRSRRRATSLRGLNGLSVSARQWRVTLNGLSIEEFGVPPDQLGQADLALCRATAHVACQLQEIAERERRGEQVSAQVSSRLTSALIRALNAVRGRRTAARQSTRRKAEHYHLDATETDEFAALVSAAKGAP